MKARAFAVVAMLLVVAGSATAAIARARHDGPSMQPGSDSTKAGADSARVASLLTAVGTGDALVCEMIADQIGNFWSDEGDDGIGRFADARPSLSMAKDSLHRRVSDPGAERLLLATLGAENPCVRRTAAKLLGRSRIETARISALLNDASARIRESAAYALGMGSRRHDARAALETALGSRGPAEAAMAAWALGEIEDSASVPALERAATASDAHVRASALEALGNIKDPRSLATLQRAVEHDASAPVRAHAAHALGEIGDMSSLPVLSAAVSDPTPAVQYAAVEAIQELHDIHTAPAALTKAAQSGDMHLRKLAALALGEIHDPASIETLLGFITFDDKDVRRKTAEALGEIGSPKASAGLIRMLKDSDAEVRRAATEALGEINKEE